MFFKQNSNFKCLSQLSFLSFFTDNPRLQTEAKNVVYLDGKTNASLSGWWKWWCRYFLYILSTCYVHISPIFSLIYIFYFVFIKRVRDMELLPIVALILVLQNKLSCYSLEHCYDGDLIFISFPILNQFVIWILQAFTQHLSVRRNIQFSFEQIHSNN